MCLIQIFNQFLIQPTMTLMKSSLNERREMKMKLYVDDTFSMHFRTGFMIFILWNHLQKQFGMP
ncbi:hypothetical protein MUK42_37632 [Musa troglodytarum]|uniref:Uncharacterized protein n=1 Tax=Musa troglodytarum TaxID=320322 RepID=A0A9E7HVY0_9LILI|nr:hypothetical protein MUK42_37632 [Musa troglodytarum]